MDWLKCSENVILDLKLTEQENSYTTSSKLELADVSYNVELGLFGDEIRSKVSMDSLQNSLWNLKLQQKVVFLPDNVIKNIQEVTIFQLGPRKNSHETVLESIKTFHSEDIDPNSFLTIQFELKVVESFGVKNLASSTLAERLYTTSDVSLVVENKEIRVNKGFLTTISEYFCSLFNGNFKEKDQEKVELKDIVYNQIADFLMILHGVHTNVNGTNYVYLLELSAIFQVSSINGLCEEYMLTLKEFYVNGNYVERLSALSLSEKYQLPRVQHIIVSSMDTLEDLNQVVASREFLDLMDSTKVFLFQYAITHMTKKFKCGCGREHTKVQSYCSNCGSYSKLTY